MKVIFLQLAWRNIWRHRGSSIVIGSILFLGTLIMSVGNSLVSGMQKGINKNIVNCFTGDAVIVSNKQTVDNVFLDMSGKSVAPINNYGDVSKLLDSQKYIVNYLPMGKNVALILNENDGPMGSALLLGVNYKDYIKAFPSSFELLEGTLPKENERFALLPTGARSNAFDVMNVWFIPSGFKTDTSNLTVSAKKAAGNLKTSHDLVLLGYNNDNTVNDIRLPLDGVIKYKSLNSVWGNFILTDIESYRRCLGYFTASDKASDLTLEQKTILESSTIDFEDLLQAEELIGNSSSNDKLIQKGDLQKEALPKEVTNGNFEQKKANDNQGVYNLVSVKFDSKKSKMTSLQNLNKAISESKLNVRVIDWKKTVGYLSSMAIIIKGLLFVFVFFVFFVAIIIIVNTLSMTTLERAQEIGMMRAIGAKKGFVKKLLLWETSLLSIAFGSAGILSGVIISFILSILNIHASNDMVQLLFGGDTLSPLITIGDFILSIIQLVFVTIVATIYPMNIAGRIKPMDAIYRD